MLERRSRHIEELAARESAVAKQFVASEEELVAGLGEIDPLLEDKHQVVRGLIHKYENRVLCLLTVECAAYCRFCTRRRVVSDIEHGKISHGDIENWVDYITAHTQVKEVILSGGDPFVVPNQLFTFAFEKLAAIPAVSVLRLGTRTPVTAPELITEEKLLTIDRAHQPVYIGIHFEHPSEITDKTIQAVMRLRKSGAILYSQSVFLKGVNDDYNTLHELFTRLVEIGVRPYYIYRCDLVEGVAHFRSDFQKERSIMTELRKNLGGLACPTYVIDTPLGSGKIPAPLDFWDADCSHYFDYDGNRHEVE